MKRQGTVNFDIESFSSGWRLVVLWLLSLGTILLLGVWRMSVDADFTFATLAIVPVLLIARIAGRWQGLLAAVVAATMWTVADIAVGRDFSSQWIPWSNAVTRLLTYCLVAMMAAQVRQQFKREHRYATQDSLTGLKNRRFFLNAGIGEAARAARYKHSLGLIFLDLDNFKQLNDTRGHGVGDEALKATAAVMRDVLRSSDYYARLGGDEFAIILPEIDYTAACEVGQKIELSMKIALADFSPVTMSCGLAWFEKAERLFPAMLMAADDLMYEAKKQGKNRMCCQAFYFPAGEES